MNESDESASTYPERWTARRKFFGSFLQKRTVSFSWLSASSVDVILFYRYSVAFGLRGFDRYVTFKNVAQHQSFRVSVEWVAAAASAAGFDAQDVALCCRSVAIGEGGEDAFVGAAGIDVWQRGRAAGLAAGGAPGGVGDAESMRTARMLSSARMVEFADHAAAAAEFAGAAAVAVHRVVCSGSTG